MDILNSILLSDKPSLELIKNEEYIFELIPELRACKGFNQRSKWHIYDVYEHILHVLDGVESDYILRMAALFHDIGKPLVFTVDQEGQGHFYLHWEKSNEIFNKFSNQYSLDSGIINMVSKLIYYHDLKLSNVDDLDSILKQFDIDNIKRLYKLKRSDLLAQNSDYHYQIEDINKEEEKILEYYK